MRLVPIWRTKLVVGFTILAAVWNTFVLFNYQYARQSLKNCPTAIKEQGKILVFGKTESRSYLKGLQKEINETFRRFEAKNHTVGKAFRLASLHGKEGEQQTETRKSLPDCTQRPYLLILVHSAPANFMEREAIRLSWGRPQNSINQANAGKQLIPWFWKTVFLVGKTRNPSLDEMIRQEAVNNEDIVFGDFIDSYRNLTRKMVLGVEWAALHCQAQYVMKVDDDSFVAVLELTQLLEEYQGTQGHNKTLYLGAALINKEPFREEDNKFYVSEKEYPAKLFPPYAAGPGYVFSGSLLAKLSNATKFVRLFPNEDACFGALMQHIKVDLVNNDRFIPFSTGKIYYMEGKGYSLCKFNGPLVIHRISGKLQIATHFNVLVLKHASTICEHINHGIGITDYLVDTFWSFH